MAYYNKNYSTFDSNQIPEMQQLHQQEVDILGLTCTSIALTPDSSTKCCVHKEKRPISVSVA